MRAFSTIAGHTVTADKYTAALGGPGAFVCCNQQRLRAAVGQSFADTIELGFNEQTMGTSQVGSRVSFFGSNVLMIA